MRQFIKLFVSTVFYYSGLFFLIRQWHNLRGRRLTILTFHRVTNYGEETRRYGLPTICVDLENFDKLIRYIKKRYRVIPVSDYLSWSRNKKKLPSNSLIISFDDGYKETIDNASPVLTKYRLSALLFVPTDFIDKGGSFWWDEIYSALANSNDGRFVENESNHPLSNDIIKQLNQIFAKSRKEKRLAIIEIIELLINSPVRVRESAIRYILEKCQNLNVTQSPKPSLLTWDDIKKLSESGFAIGSHTVSHQFLSTVSDQETLDELRQSKIKLEKKINRKISAFSYPGGRYNNRTEELVKQAGYTTAFTTNEGINAFDTNLHKLKRVNISDDEVTDHHGKFSKTITAWTLYFK